MFYRFKKCAVLVLAAAMAVMMLAGCGKTDGSKSAITVNGETLSLGAANTYARYEQAASYAIMQAYGIIQEGAAYWDTDYTQASEDGETPAQTYGQYIKDEMQNDLIKMMLVRQHAGDYGYTLSAEDQAAISEAAAKFIADNGSVANWIGADQASVENLLSLFNHQSKMRDLMIADTDRNVTDEEAAQSTAIYARITTSSLPDGYEGTEEEYAAEAKGWMESLLETAKTADLDVPDEHTDDADAADEEADTETEEAPAAEEMTLSERIETEQHNLTHLAADVNENITVNKVSFGDDDEAPAAEVLEAARTLKDGEWYDGVIETDSGYFIVRMEAVFDEDATETEKDTIIADRENAHYDELVQSWQDAAEITVDKAWSDITITDKETYKTAAK